MQSGSDPPHRVVAHDAGQAEGGDDLSEGGVGSCKTQTQQGGDACTERDRKRLGNKLPAVRNVYSDCSY